MSVLQALQNSLTFPHLYYTPTHTCCITHFIHYYIIYIIVSTTSMLCRNGDSDLISGKILKTADTMWQGCSLGLDVSVSRRSRDVVSKRLGLVSVS